MFSSTQTLATPKAFSFISRRVYYIMFSSVNISCEALSLYTLFIHNHHHINIIMLTQPDPIPVIASVYWPRYEPQNFVHYIFQNMNSIHDHRWMVRQICITIKLHILGNSTCQIFVMYGILVCDEILTLFDISRGKTHTRTWPVSDSCIRLCVC